VIVTLVGIKMLIMDLYKVPIIWMLGAVAVALVVSISASLLRSRGGRSAADTAQAARG